MTNNKLANYRAARRYWLARVAEARYWRRRQRRDRLPHFALRDCQRALATVRKVYLS